MLSKLFPCLFLCLFSSITFAEDSIDVKLSLKRAVNSLTRLLDYMYQRRTEINLDGVIGTRIVDGTFQVMLRRFTKYRQLLADSFYGPLMAKINKLQLLAANTSDAAIPYIERETPQYYKEIGPILNEGFWQLDEPSRDLDLSMVTRMRMNRGFLRENESDLCISELIGTRHPYRKCGISDSCWLMMTSPGYTSYSLTHEVFYLEVGIMSGCLDRMDEFAARYNQRSTEYLMKFFCANILREAHDIANSNFPPLRRDLFMEQAALCGLAGFRQFFSSRFLEQILSWQSPTSGCYGLSNNGNDTLKTLLDRSRNKLKGSVMDKRYEKPLENDCLSHRSSVAAGALAQYVRYITEHLLEI